MENSLTVTRDKFTFQIPTDRRYTPEGLWLLPEGAGVRLGLSDFLQQRSGDIAFAEVRPVGTALIAGDELASIETIKVDVSLETPLSGRLVEINPALESAPEIINQDPYGAGWLAVIAAARWEVESPGLLTPQEYAEHIRRLLDQEPA